MLSAGTSRTLADPPSLPSPRPSPPGFLGDAIGLRGTFLVCAFICCPLPLIFLAGMHPSVVGRPLAPMAPDDSSAAQQKRRSDSPIETGHGSPYSAAPYATATAQWRPHPEGFAPTAASGYSHGDDGSYASSDRSHSSGHSDHSSYRG